MIQKCIKLEILQDISPLWYLINNDMFPKLSSHMHYCRVGVVFSGRQSPGGHNVIWGIHKAIKIHNPDSVLIGFLGKHSSHSTLLIFQIFYSMFVHCY